MSNPPTFNLALTSFLKPYKKRDHNFLWAGFTLSPFLLMKVNKNLHILRCTALSLLSTIYGPDFNHKPSYSDVFTRQIDLPVGERCNV